METLDLQLNYLQEALEGVTINDFFLDELQNLESDLKFKIEEENEDQNYKIKIGSNSF